MDKKLKRMDLITRFNPPFVMGISSILNNHVRLTKGKIQYIELEKSLLAILKLVESRDEEIRQLVVKVLLNHSGLLPDDIYKIADKIHKDS